MCPLAARLGPLFCGANRGLCGNAVLPQSVKQKPLNAHLTRSKPSSDPETPYIYKYDECISNEGTSFDRGDWNPVRMVLDYDPGAMFHRLLPKDECSELFDAQTFRNIFGESAESKWLKAAIYQIQRAFKWTQTELADRLGVSQSMITHYRAGKYEPSKEAMAKLEQMSAEASAIHACTFWLYVQSLA